jgi:hypothetical protein
MLKVGLQVSCFKLGSIQLGGFQLWRCHNSAESFEQIALKPLKLEAAKLEAAKLEASHSGPNGGMFSAQ